MMEHKLRERRVLVTGGCGFLGSEVVNQLLGAGSHVTILDNLTSGKLEYVPNSPRVKIIIGDICDAGTLSQAMKDQELLVHLAALPFIPDSYQYPYDFFRINLMGTVTLVSELIKSKSVERFVHISSSEVYGSALYVPMDERHPTLPHSTYAVSKLAAERAVFTMHKEHGFPATIIRPFNTYGPRVTQPYVIPEIIIQLLANGETLKLGNVESIRDFTYCQDTAMGIIQALVADKSKVNGETINLGSGRGIKIKELAEMIARLMGKETRIQTDASRFRPYDVETLVCDYSKAKELLGWEPRISLEEGLRLTIEWMSANRPNFRSPFKGWATKY